jgi:uncharacterized membrane protein YdbT with pleckstrin-like domain
VVLLTDCTAKALWSPVKPSLATMTVINDVELRQAVFRTNLFALVILAMSVCLVLMADSVLLSVLEIIKVQPGQLGLWWQRLDQGLTGFGAFLLVTIWLSFLWQWAGALYRVTDFGVEARLGIIAHQTVGLRFQDIRSMSIKQSLLDRVLNVGLLEFTSAGTDGDPVRFNRVAHPAQVLRIVKARMAGTGSVD